MKKILLLITLAGAFSFPPFLAAVKQEEPEQASLRERLNKLLAVWRKADRLDVKARVAQILTDDAGETRSVNQELELHLARPLLGWGTFKVGGANHFENELIADGEAVYVLHPAKTDPQRPPGSARGRRCERLSKTFDGAFGNAVPLLAWSAPALKIEPKTVEAVADNKAPELQGLRLSFDDRVETLWTDAKGRLVRSTIEMRVAHLRRVDGGVAGAPTETNVETTYTFEQFEAATGGDLAPYTRALPAGCEMVNVLTPHAPLNVLMPHAPLIPGGTRVPDVSVRDLSGTEIPLRSLAGKTVLLHFWFFG